jgi:hypothetical protein
MINLIKGSTQYIYLTLTEKELLTSPNYLFRFVNRSSNLEVKFILLNAADISLYKERYNKFSIVVNTYFTNSIKGMYTYEVYEQMSTSNTNIAGLNMLESGIMTLDTINNVYTEYATTDTYKIRE